ncbi:MAG: zinc metallopeptidase [Lachnospiraceae bacterium]|nr:zinc metallopeptidase [Lachnospiraceae bacterium]
MYWDWTYILVLIGAAISALASLGVKNTFSKYSKVLSNNRLTSEEVALRMLNQAGIFDVSVERVSGNLTDHYSPSEKVLRLSDSVYGKSSVAAIGVAAHECGHAIQHKEGYAPLTLRSVSVPLCKFGSWFYWPTIILGVILGLTGLTRVGILFFTLVVFFQLITLPVEFNASHRAINILESSGMLVAGEVTGAKKVLKAAAMTYVAALLTSLLQLLRLVLLYGGGRRRRR